MRDGGKSKLADFFFITDAAKTLFDATNDLMRRSETEVVYQGGALLQRVV